MWDVIALRADFGRLEESSWSGLLNICSALVTPAEMVHRILHFSAGGVIWLSPKLTHVHYWNTPLAPKPPSHPDSHDSLLSYIKRWDFKGGMSCEHAVCISSDISSCLRLNSTHLWVIFPGICWNYYPDGLKLVKSVRNAIVCWNDTELAALMCHVVRLKLNFFSFETSRMIIVKCWVRSEWLWKL